MITDYNTCDLERALRFRLWSIEELQEFDAYKYGLGMSALVRIIAYIEEKREELNEEEILNIVAKTLADEVKGSFHSLPLSTVVCQQFTRLEIAIENHDLSLDVLKDRLAEYHKNITVEVYAHNFYLIPESRKMYYETPIIEFGQEVCDTYSVSKDVTFAGQCLALEQWTACVFHLMRILETGLHDLGITIGLDAEDIKFDNWKNIIDKIESKIKKLENTLPRGTAKSETLKFYSEAASCFRIFKEAWRNHVSHARVTYDKKETIDVYNNVRSFMKTLAENKLKTP